jgi:hypothetical protein
MRCPHCDHPVKYGDQHAVLKHRCPHGRWCSAAKDERQQLLPCQECREFKARQMMLFENDEEGEC